MNNQNNNDNDKKKNNYDRRPQVDIPTAESSEKSAPAVSAKRKGFYIILLLGITALGIYTIISSLSSSPDTDNNIKTYSALETASPGHYAVPANVDTLPSVISPSPSPSPDLSDTSEATTESSSPQLAQAPVSGKIIKDFSADELLYSETMRDWRTHGGVDIGANIGTPVTAIKDGTLKKVYEDSLFGTTVVVHHQDDSVDSVYCGMTNVTDIPIGSDIKIGDILGYVGNTAVSEINDEPHLHFEIKLDDTYLDPKEFVKFEDVEYIDPRITPVPTAAPSENSEDEAATNKTTPAPAAGTPVNDPYIYDDDIETMLID